MDMVYNLIRQLLQENSNQSIHCLYLPFCKKIWCTKFQDNYHKIYMYMQINVHIKIPSDMHHVITIQHSLFKTLLIRSKANM